MWCNSLLLGDWLMLFGFGICLRFWYVFRQHLQMLQRQLRYQSLHLLVPEFLVDCDNKLHGYLSLVRVAGLYTFLNFSNHQAERKCRLWCLLQLILIFIEISKNSVNKLHPWYNVPKIVRVVLIYVGSGLEQEVYEEVAIVLVNVEELEEALLGLSWEFGVS